MNIFRLSLGTVIVILPLAVGCGGPAPVGVTGEVSFDGEPLPSGTIVFEPNEGSDGQRRDATIENGRFALPDDQGMLPGQEFRVVIKAFRKTGRKYPNADISASFDETEQYLPKKYNASSTLSATISPDAEKNHFTFELVSSPE